MTIDLRMLHIFSRLMGRRGRSMPRSTLAEEVELSERQVRRLVNQYCALREVSPPLIPFGLPDLATETREGRAWLTLEPAVEHTAAALRYAAVQMAVRHLTPLDTEVIGGNAELGVNSLDAAAVPGLDARVQQGFYYRPLAPKRYEGGEALDDLETIFESVFHRRVVRFDYRSASSDEARARTVEPWTLVTHRDGFYLLARIVGSERDHPTLFSVDRIEHVVPVEPERTFDVPEDYDPEAEFEGIWGIWRTRAEPASIRLAFEPDVARNAAERSWPGFVAWHEPDADASDARPVLELELPVTPDVVVWVMSWGASVEVLAPASLRTEVCERVDALATLYDR